MFNFFRRKKTPETTDTSSAEQVQPASTPDHSEAATAPTQTTPAVQSSVTPVAPSTTPAATTTPAPSTLASGYNPQGLSSIFAKPTTTTPPVSTTETPTVPAHSVSPAESAVQNTPQQAPQATPSVTTPRIETPTETSATVVPTTPAPIVPVLDTAVVTTNTPAHVTPVSTTSTPIPTTTLQPSPLEVVREDTGTAEPADEGHRGWFSRLKSGLSKTGRDIKNVFVAHKVDEVWFENLEDALLMADVGVNATEQVMATVRQRVKKERIDDATAVKQVVKQTLIELLRPLEAELDIEAHKPLVLMIAGVNGAGKTTSIGKLTHHLQQMNKKIILAAGDTFRAAAREQLAAWGARNNVTVIAQESGDPAAVVFDAIASAQAKGIDVVIADTAGRLPTQLHLMDELKKIKRVAEKSMTGSPHEVILVLDGSMGQNALAQVKAFDEAVKLTGLIVTKLDGSAKGGVLAALAVERKIPVYFIGVGEGIHDLQTFDAVEFVDALLDD